MFSVPEVLRAVHATLPREARRVERLCLRELTLALEHLSQSAHRRQLVGMLVTEYTMLDLDHLCEDLLCLRLPT